MDTDEKLSGLCLSSETKTNGIGETALCVVVGVSIVFNILLIPMFGLYGAIVASIITNAFLTGIYILFAWRQVNDWLLEKRSLLLILITAFAGFFQFCIMGDRNVVSYAIMIGIVLLVVFIGINANEYFNIRNRLYKFASGNF